MPHLKREIIETLNSGSDVAFFPEATTGKGDDLLRYRAGALSTVFNDHAEVKLDNETIVQPFAIRLTHVDGKSVQENSALQDHFAWYRGGHNMLSHLWNLLQAKTTDIEVTAMPEMDYKDYSDPITFAQAAENLTRPYATFIPDSL